MFARNTRQRFWIALLALATLAPALTGCALFGGAGSPAAEVMIDEEPLPDDGILLQEAPAEEEEAFFPDESAVEAKEDVGAAAGAPAAEGDFAGATMEPMATASPLAEMEAGAEMARSEEAPAAEPVEPADAEFAPEPQQVLNLKAGEIDDNENWDDYLLYRRDFLEQGWLVHDVDVTGRHIINVRTADGLPVLGARVQVYAGQTLVSDSLTYATGQTLFFPNATREAQGEDNFVVTVEKDGQSVEFTLNVRETNEWFVTLDDVKPASQQRVDLDVLFLIDATGSMADEIEQLQSNILSISEQVDAFPANVHTRYGMVTYRDITDDYVTRVYDFTPNVRRFQSDLSEVRAAGGDDYPESLNRALHEAIHRTEWRVDDTVSLIFLVADAPPHLDYPQDDDYAQEMVAAARRGIKIHPIGSSGLSPDGEFIFRQLAQYTMGHFIFLAYEQPQGDYGRPELAAGGEDYTVEALDDLVVRLIGDELDALFGE